MEKRKRGRPRGLPRTGGRKRGTLNRVTVEQKDRAEKILQLIESAYLESDIEKLSPTARMTLYTTVMEYRLPKLARTEISGNAEIVTKQVFIIGGKEIVL